MSKVKTDRVGTICVGSDGNKAECIEYNDYKHIKIKFLDYDIVANTNWNRFQKGEFSLKNYQKYLRIGQERINRRGDKGKCVEYFNNTNITIELEDGTRVKNLHWSVFDRGDFYSSDQLPEHRIGKIFTNKYGIRAECIEYNGASDIVIKFIDYDYTMKTTWTTFSSGEFCGDTYKLMREKSERFNSNGLCGVCIVYNSADDILIKNKDSEEIIHTQWSHFDAGCFEFINSTPNRYGGFHGGVYPAYVNKKTTKEYNCWIQMLRRCFDEDYKKVQPTYVNAKPCDDFMYYTFFYEYLLSRENYCAFKNEDIRWEIDKDIVGGKGNKLYSPETTSIVPTYINSLFTKGDKHRFELGKEEPIGVHYRYGKYRAICSDPFIGKNAHLGNYNTEIEAFNAYKEYKEMVIKKMAEQEYNVGHIDKRCYEAMMNYEVEITD